MQMIGLTIIQMKCEKILYFGLKYNVNGTLVVGQKSTTLEIDGFWTRIYHLLVTIRHICIN